MALTSDDSVIRLQIPPFAVEYIREADTSLMTSTCRIFTPDITTNYNPATGRVTSGPGTTKYTGPCRVWEVPAGQQVVVGGEELVTVQTYFSIPYSVFPLPEAEDVVAIITSDDPDLVGRSLSIISTVRGGGLRASRRFLVQVSDSKRASW
jgi:hypothetical protein